MFLNMRARLVKSQKRSRISRNKEKKDVMINNENGNTFRNRFQGFWIETEKFCFVLRPKVRKRIWSFDIKFRKGVRLGISHFLFTVLWIIQRVLRFQILILLRFYLGSEKNHKMLAFVISKLQPWLSADLTQTLDYLNLK